MEVREDVEKEKRVGGEVEIWRGGLNGGTTGGDACLAGERRGEKCIKTAPGSTKGMQFQALLQGFVAQ